MPLAESGASGGSLINVATQFLGSPYRFGGNGQRGFDCSGFVRTVYSAVGVELPRSAREQFRVGRRVPTHELRPGDLVFFRTYRPHASHVGIYLGSGLFVHAATRGREVRIDSLDDDYYRKRYLGARRLSLGDLAVFESGEPSMPEPSCKLQALCSAAAGPALGGLRVTGAGV